MNKVMGFLGDVNTPVVLGTVGNNEPRVRFFSFKMVEDGELYFITSKKKAIYQELSENNNIELCSMPNQEKAWIRIQGKVEFVTNVELNKKAFSLLPLLEMAYNNPENEDIVLLKIKDMSIKEFTLAGKVETLSFN